MENNNTSEKFMSLMSVLEDQRKEWRSIWKKDIEDDGENWERSYKVYDKIGALESDLFDLFCGSN